jgi:hypothetical protein
MAGAGLSSGWGDVGGGGIASFVKPGDAALGIVSCSTRRGRNRAALQRAAFSAGSSGATRTIGLRRFGSRASARRRDRGDLRAPPGFALRLDRAARDVVFRIGPRLRSKTIRGGLASSISFTATSPVASEMRTVEPSAPLGSTRTLTTRPSRHVARNAGSVEVDDEPGDLPALGD